jgi:hypothetical protein
MPSIMARCSSVLSPTRPSTLTMGSVLLPLLLLLLLLLLPSPDPPLLAAEGG